MIRMKAALISVLVLSGLLTGGTAFAHGGHVRLGVYFGAPVYSPFYYPVPRYYYPPTYYYEPVVIVPAAPPVYIEQSAPPAPQTVQSSGNYWYYCAASKTYYPYVQQCAEGWQKVSPHPPS